MELVPDYLGGDFEIVNNVLQFDPMANYGSEMVNGKIAVEQTKEIRYDLRSIGVPIEGPSIMFGDNESVVKSTTIPNSSLKRKSLLLAFHTIREAIVANIINLFHMPGKENPVDCLAKFIHGDEWSRLEDDACDERRGSDERVRKSRFRRTEDSFTQARIIPNRGS